MSRAAQGRSLCAQRLRPPCCLRLGVPGPSLLRSSEMTCTSSYCSGSSPSRLCLSMALRITAGALSWLVTWIGVGTGHQGNGPRVAPPQGGSQGPSELPQHCA